MMSRECAQASSPPRLAALTNAAAKHSAPAHRRHLIDGQTPPAVLLLVELPDRLSCAPDIAHFDERKSMGLASGAIAHDADARNLS
jgi:hypothetical protein